MKNLKTALISVTSLIAAHVGYAVPYLQLDIPGGVYNTATETIVATTTSFSLRALVKQGDADFIKGGFYISATVLPGSSGTSFGSFKVDGVTFTGADMQFGTPPVDIAYPNLPSHGIYPAYYTEIAFAFNPLNLIPAYNSQDHSAASGSLTYHDFLIDASGLNSGLVVHFDLYQTEIDQVTKKRVIIYNHDTEFAPFSHDAEGGNHNHNVPDNGTSIALLGMGLIGLAALRSKFSRN